MEYPQRTDLIMPEYGRNVQQMVDHAITISDREERMKCAQTIINVMGNMFPCLRDVNEFKHKLWDHLAMMSRYQLDIDYPYEIVPKDKNIEIKEKIPYPVSKIRYMHYGYLVQDMVKVALDMEEGERKDNFVIFIANYMKKQYLTWNKDSVDDAKIQADLLVLSEGKLSFKDVALKDSKELVVRKKQRQNNHRKNNK
ncbi:MAG: DUF4290 domain-containing protein [Paludibacteraceae bacterium]|nr:DUF4290 domain-containing protein [Paludibacteraceae bacterium]